MVSARQRCLVSKRSFVVWVEGESCCQIGSFARYVVRGAAFRTIDVYEGGRLDREGMLKGIHRDVLMAVRRVYPGSSYPSIIASGMAIARCAASAMAALPSPRSRRMSARIW